TVATASATATPLPLPPPPGMVPVPAGEFVMGSNDSVPDEWPEGKGYLALFYIDRAEATNAQYQRCVDDGRCTPPLKLASATHTAYYTNPFYAEYPVVNIDWTQARAYCEAQGKRLPTEAEWEKAARGPDGLIYPWGNTWDNGLLNAWGAGDGGDTQAVGSFPEGASFYGALDMVGNVWEWTSSLDVPYPYNATDGREIPSDPRLRIIRGGAWGRDARNARAPDRDRRAPTEFNDNLGVRCATTQPYQPAGMDFIPAGSWVMGAPDDRLAAWKAQFGWDGLTNEQPTTAISMPAFYLDRTEVTNAQYSAFISATGHPLPLNAFDPVGLAAWNADGTFPLSLTDHPVVNVTWADADAYCAWRAKRLPTEAEWERAAKGDGQPTWPWGDQWNLENANIAESGRGTTAPVGTHPGGAGPYGTLDLAGNVWEWTSTIYRPYPYDPADGREDAASENPRVLRGGSWLDDRRAVHGSGRNSFQSTLSNNNVGFRCALDAPK
ncbi:MAG TPA: SUMF1/EgtB/PvdO family nonheme iron enzyme, partial [Herpetosiphonaceae bacterium]